MTGFFGFKMAANGRMRDLKTECGVLPGFDPATVNGKHPDPKLFTGLWDTGATGTVISPNVVAALGLKPGSTPHVYSSFM